ncbi:hypothetical protein CDAR_317901 [Caerostris darwini]|uniref:Uncharacterized protein n=1 Tax=Caerostris darwini TaxID=1538125 RepID=A0AAV4WU42_9ARAC|nr:hypothetical protein CDAR_317901 [Caerostris darwini]
MKISCAYIRDVTNNNEKNKKAKPFIAEKRRLQRRFMPRFPQIKIDAVSLYESVPLLSWLSNILFFFIHAVSPYFRIPVDIWGHAQRQVPLTGLDNAVISEREWTKMEIFPPAANANAARSADATRVSPLTKTRKGGFKAAPQKVLFPVLGLRTRHCFTTAVSDSSPSTFAQRRG